MNNCVEKKKVFRDRREKFRKRKPQFIIFCCRFCGELWRGREVLSLGIISSYREGQQQSSSLNLVIVQIAVKNDFEALQLVSQERKISIVKAAQSVWTNVDLQQDRI